MNFMSITYIIEENCLPAFAHLLSLRKSDTDGVVLLFPAGTETVSFQSVLSDLGISFNGGYVCFEKIKLFLHSAVLWLLISN